MHPFVKQLYADNGLRLSLAGLVIPDLFCVRAVELAKNCGLTITPDLLQREMERPGERRRPDFPEDMTGFFPRAVASGPEGLGVAWIYLGDSDFSRPFYLDLVGQARHLPINRLLGFATSLDALVGTEIRDAAPPAGFIFHMSRCGSTLVSRVLNAVPGFRSVSEPQPMDGVLTAPLSDPSLDPDRQICWLQSLVRAFGRQTRPVQHLFIKLDAWHIMAAPLLRRAFPEVPFLFLYRDPAEVLVSHARRSGIQMVPGLIPVQWFGETDAEIQGMSPAEYRVWVLTRLLDAARDALDSAGLIPVDYRSLPAALWRANPLGLTLARNQIRAMADTARFDAKDPGRLFQSDTAAKQQAVPPELRALMDRGLNQAFQAFLAAAGQGQ